MRLSELCAAADVPVATAKFYLREGLLPAGDRLSTTQSDYGPDHVQRLTLIRALVDGAGLSLAGVRRVLEAVDRPPRSRHDLLGEAQAAMDGPPPLVEVGATARAAAERLGWTRCAPEGLAHLQAALDIAERAGYGQSVAQLVAYGEAVKAVAVQDLDSLEADPTTTTVGGALRHVAVGTVVTDPVLRALRRLAQQDESKRRYGGEAEPPRTSSRPASAN